MLNTGKSRRENSFALKACVVVFLVAFACQSAMAAQILRVPQDFVTIQEAVDAAQAGDAISVAAGTFSENLTVDKSDIALEGVRTVLQGASVGGMGVGIHIGGTPESPVRNVGLRGFIVEGFERGIVLENVLLSRIELNEVRDSTDKSPSDGPLIADGMVLIASHSNILSGNLVRNSGHEGIVLSAGSSRNLVQGNESSGNGVQTGEGAAGCGIQLNDGENNNNQILDNVTLGNDWGILIGPTGGSGGNLVANNRSHDNHRAGLAVLGPASGNFIVGNDGTENGLFNLPLTEDVDLFEDETIDNVWTGNLGVANF